MRRRLRQLAGGRFDFTLPNVSFSVDKIDIQVKEGTDHQDEFEMISQTNIPIMQKAVNVIYDMSEDTRIREIARLREKALHDEASAIKNAKMEGREEGRVEGEAIGIAKGEAMDVVKGRAEGEAIGVVKGIAKERADAIAKMKSLGFTEEQIRSIYPQ